MSLASTTIQAGAWIEYNFSLGISTPRVVDWKLTESGLVYVTFTSATNPPVLYMSVGNENGFQSIMPTPAIENTDSSFSTIYYK